MRPQNYTLGFSDLKFEARLFRRTKGSNRRGKGEEERVSIWQEYVYKALYTCMEIPLCNQYYI